MKFIELEIKGSTGGQTFLSGKVLIEFPEKDQALAIATVEAIQKASKQTGERTGFEFNKISPRTTMISAVVQANLFDELVELAEGKQTFFMELFQKAQEYRLFAGIFAKSKKIEAQAEIKK